MALFAWNERYSVGVSCFDEQHRQLFALINALHDAVRSARTRSALQESFQQMVDYTEKHLVEEETALKLHGYPSVIVHCREHEKLRSELAQFHERYRNGATNIGLEIINFLLRWWTNHILTTDREYKNFFTGLHAAPGATASSPGNGMEPSSAR